MAPVRRTICADRNAAGTLDIPVALAILGTGVLAYAGLCLVVLQRPGWLPHGSVFLASLVGPPHWLVWGAATHTMFWGSSIVLALLVIAGARWRAFALPAAGLAMLLWLGSGFLSVAMSI